MFAVSGWSVPAASLVQQKANPKNPKNPKKNNLDKKSKKRKRSDDLDQGDRPLQRQPVSNNEHKPKHTRRHEDGDKRSTDMKVHADAPVKNYKSKTTKPSSTPKDGQTNKAVDDTAHVEASKSVVVTSKNASTQSGPKLTPLQEKMRNKLTSARFRHLNEKLYTTSSSDALNLFSNSPELFAEYHAGFSQQVKDSWPQNPVEGYIKSLKARGNLTETRQGVVPLPRRKTGSCTIADLGCGDAPLARGCQSVIRQLKFKFHSYDLHTPNSLVTKADISNLPLRDGEADIAIFCLSLMGTNWVSFVEEAWRILRGDGRGEIWVAEVKSRFGKIVKGRVVDNSVGKRRKKQNTKPEDQDGYDAPEQFVHDERNAEEDDETDISNFVKVFTRRGFQLKEDSVNKKNKMFVSMVFFKTGIPTAGKHKGLKWNGKEYVKQPEGKGRFMNGQGDDGQPSPEEEAKTLKPCVYKIR